MVRFRERLRGSLRTVGVIATVTSVLAAAAAPLVLPLYYGSALHVPATVLAALAVSTAVAATAAVAVQPLLASGRGRWAASCWLSGALITIAGLAMSTGTDLLAAATLVGGPVVALVGAFIASGSLLRYHASLAVTA